MLFKSSFYSFCLSSHFIFYSVCLRGEQTYVGL